MTMLERPNQCPAYAELARKPFGNIPQSGDPCNLGGSFVDRLHKLYTRRLERHRVLLEQGPVEKIKVGLMVKHARVVSALGAYQRLESPGTCKAIQ